jgi:death-on-curing protein
VTEPAWVERRVVLALHDRLLAEHGGAGGVRDEGLLDSALARPKQLQAYRGDLGLERDDFISGHIRRW